MRNQQLIRQWKILRAIADGIFLSDQVNTQEVAAFFDVHEKTIQRDLVALRHAGFLVYGQTTVGKQVRQQYYQPKHKPRVVFRAALDLKPAADSIHKLLDDALAEVNLLRCNQCPYVFKSMPSGRIDMRDFHRHKDAHNRMDSRH